MNVLLPFYVAGFGLLCSVTGAWGLLSTVRARSEGASAEDPTSPSAAAMGMKTHSSPGLNRIVGIFWFCLGVATLWFSDFRAPWIMPSVGLFWAVIGAWSFLATFRPRDEAAIAAAAYAKALASNPHARRWQQIVSVLTLCLGIVTVCFSGIRVGASSAVVSQSPEENSRLAEIVTRQVERDVAQQAHVGLVVGAIANSEEVLLGFGTRRVGTSRPPDADTVFEIGSITKVFTGLLLAQMIEDGEWELDDRIADLLPEEWSLPEAAREITLRHCTTHTSGIPRLPANLFTAAGVFRHLLGGDPYRDYSEQKFRHALATVELQFEPGADRLYSNFAVGLLGFVLAARNGSDYETLVTSKICKPLGMQRTAIIDDSWHREHRPAKYRSAVQLGPAIFAVESDEWRIPNHLAGAGALRSTGRDMMTFLKANMGLIPTTIGAAIERSHQELFREGAGRGMGMNWIRSFDGNISRNIIWHNGGTGGFSTYLGFTEDCQVGVFVLSNTALGVDALAGTMISALVQEYASDSGEPGPAPPVR